MLNLLIKEELKLMIKVGYRIQRIRTNFQRFGARKVFKYLLIDGLIKRIKNPIYTYLKRDKYTQNIIFISSLPKSGSTWTAKMFKSLAGFDQFAPLKWNTSIQKEWSNIHWDIYEGLFQEFKNNLAVIRGHTWGHDYNVEILRSNGLKSFLVVRDPRDTIISEYWHSRNYPLQWNREIVENRTLSEYIAYVFQSGDFEKQTLNWIRDWLKYIETESVYILKYEDLLSDTFSTMKNAFEFLNFKVNDNEIESIIKLNSFEKLTGRKRGVEDSSKFIRKGISGEWKEVFSDEQKIYFHSIGEDIIQQLGYEPTV